MRKNIMFIFIFVFWGLAVCTILSAKIEEQMTAQVVTKRAQNRTLPLDSLLYDAEGNQHLYKVVLGEGWEGGRRAAEVSLGNYVVNEEDIKVEDTSPDYIRYVTKEIVSGDLVQTVPFYRSDPADYLVIDGGNASVVSVEEEQLPFLQEVVKAELELPEESFIYNLNDVRDFLGNFPIFGGMLAMLASSIMIWGFSWHCARDLRKNRYVLIANVGIGAGLLFGFWKIVEKVQLPQSLLPQDNIFEMGYYRAEFAEIFEMLMQCSETFSKEITGIFTKNVIWASVIFGAVVLLSFVWIYAEKRFCKQ